MRSFSAIFVVLYTAHIVPTCLRLLHMLRQFAQHLLSHGNLRAAGVCRLLYVHDSLVGRVIRDRQGVCRWEAESSGRTTIIKFFVFAIGIGTEIAVRRSEWWGWCQWAGCLACRVETAVGIHSGW